MIQFNLLPDVKLEYLRTSRIKRTVMIIAGITGIIATVVFVTLFMTVRVLQKNHLAKLDEEVKTKVSELKAIPDINKMLTIQNQLNKLPALHDQKPVASRLFGYLAQITPEKASISDLEIEFGETKAFKVTGTADNFTTVNKFIDTIKFTEFSITYTPEQLKQQKHACSVKELNFDEAKGVQTCAAFASVVLASYELKEKGTDYEIKFVFDPLIFDSRANVALNVPNITTTRSELEKPDPNSPLFQQTTEPEEEATR